MEHSMCKYRLIILSLLIVFSAVHPAFGQTYSKLSPNSDLYCVYLPNGKTRIAVGKGDTYKTMGFKRAQKRTAKNSSRNRVKARKITRLIKKLQRQQNSGSLSINLNPKDVKAVQKFYLQGDLDIEVSPSISENIAKLESIRSTFYNNVDFNREIIKLIKKCKRREVPSPGTLPTMFINVMTSKWNAEHDSSGSGYVIVAAVVPAYIALQYPYLCYDHPTQSTRYDKATTDPCYAEGIKNFLTEDCANIVDRDSKGRPEFYLAALDKRNFYFKNRPGAASFTEAAAAAEVKLRTDDIYGWGDSVPYVTVPNIDACKSSAF